MSSANGKKNLALLAAGVLGSTAVTASAAPYLNVTVLGKIQGSADPFSSSVVVNPGDIVEYQVQVQLGQEGAVNLNASPVANTTITNWIPSQGSTSPTSGLNNVRFNLVQQGIAGDMIVDFDNPLQLAADWAVGSGASGGTPTPRADGSDDLNSVFFNRLAGNFDGIGAAEELEVLTIGSGVFDIAGGGNPTLVTPSISGFTSTTAIAGMRWRNASNTGNINYNPTVLHQTNSTDGGIGGPDDPLVIYNGLSLVPEPATVGLLGLAGAGLLARRRRA